MEVYINGIGILSRCALSEKELAETVSGRAPATRPLPLEFKTEIDPAKIRRSSRYNKMACAAADAALKQAGIPDQTARGSLDSRRVGTVFSTGYGAAEYSGTFADAVVKGDPGLCSPARFAGSVPNACLGQVCIVNGLRGFSTLLAGGDPLEYAVLLLKGGRADAVLAGSVETYWAPLYEAFREIRAAEGCSLSEGAAMAVLSGEKTEGSLCRVTQTAGISLGRCPWLHLAPEEAEPRERVEAVLRRFPRPDTVLTCANGGWFDRPEAEALQAVFAGVPARAPKEAFGETLGCGYMLNVLYGAALLREGSCGSVLACGADMIGNYCCAMLERA